MTVTCTFKKEKKEEADGEKQCMHCTTHRAHSFIHYVWLNLKQQKINESEGVCSSD